MAAHANSIGRFLKAILARALFYSGGFLFLRRLHRHWFGPCVKILTFHRLNSNTGPIHRDNFGRAFLRARQFERRLRHLRRFYRVLSLAEAVEYLQAGTTLPENAVVVTFDDGFADFYRIAFPLLKKHRVPATVFVTTDAIDKGSLWFQDLQQLVNAAQASELRLSFLPEPLPLRDPALRQEALQQVLTALLRLPATKLQAAAEELRRLVGLLNSEPTPSPFLRWDELRAMSASGLVTIGAHTVSHPALPSSSMEEIEREVAGSCRRIEDELKQPVRFFAYPHGTYDAATCDVIRRLGLVGCASDGAGFNPPGVDRSALRRLGGEARDHFWFALFLAGWFDVAAQLHALAQESQRALKRTIYAALHTLGFFAWTRRRQRRKLTVLFYHGVTDSSNGLALNNLHVPLAAFQKQMQWLRRRFTPVTLEQALAGLEGKGPLPPRAVLVTFDDGYRNNLQAAWPILRRLDIPAVFFVPTGYVGNGHLYWSEELEYRLLHTSADSVHLPTGEHELLWLRNARERRAAFWKLSQCLKALSEEERGEARKALAGQLPLPAAGSVSPGHDRMSWEELGRLAREGAAIGSHTVQHALLPRLSCPEADAELRKSKQILEERLGQSVVAFAYPSGAHDPDTRAQVEQAGYRCAFTTEPGGNDTRTDRMALRRIGVNATDSFGEFVANLSGVPQLFARPGVR